MPSKTRGAILRGSRSTDLRVANDPVSSTSVLERSLPQTKLARFPGFHAGAEGAPQVVVVHMFGTRYRSQGDHLEPVIADLFAGAGGFTEGFRRAGYRPVLAVEYDKWAARTYVANFGEHVLACPIESVVVQSAGDSIHWLGSDCDGRQVAYKTPPIDVLIGGPPCQGFSPLGRMNDWEKQDPRNKLWQHYARVLGAVQPRVFIIENVPELLTSLEFKMLLKAVRKLGYDVKYDVLNAADYGVPQRRRRAFVIGSRVGEPTFPEPVLRRRTVADAIGDLSRLPDGANLHVGRKPLASSVERYKCVPAGGNRFDLLTARPDLTPECWKRKKTGSTDVFGRMLWNEPSPTIRTEFFKPEKGRYLHPEADRPITLREAARLQTFPDKFLFVGSSVQVAKQIGNAVPVLLAETIAKHVRVTLLGKAKQRSPIEPVLGTGAAMRT